MKNYMTRILLLAALSLTATSVTGATVKFGDAVLDGQVLDIYFLGKGGSLYMIFDYTFDASSIVIHSRPNGNLQYGIAAVQSSAGAIASSVYFDNQTEYFSYGDRDNALNSHSDYDITILIDDSAYIAYQVDNAYCGYLYGWFQLGYANGELTLKNSAIDLDGDSIVVGAIPEPSSAILLLLGVAGLALRRQRDIQELSEK